MSAQPLAIVSTGLMSSVGFSAPAACAAIRAGLTNPAQTHFVDSAGENIMSHCVQLEEPWRGLEKLARMAASVIEECLAAVPRDDWTGIPLLLCVAEDTRPGRLDGLEDRLPEQIDMLLGASFSPLSAVIPHGRVGAAVAILQARKLIYEKSVSAVLIVATDSLLTGPTLTRFEKSGRLLTANNSNGFIPGEGAAALLIGKPAGTAQLHIEGLGFGMEAASIDAEIPLRADGLTQAIRSAVEQAGVQMHDLDFRIADLSGEQYYFKEAALALGRTLRTSKSEIFDLWHPAECIGEAGSVIVPALLAVAEAACRKGYAAGPSILLHAANDAGQRAAIVVRYRVH
jgi:3-oxoacyl-[acyl-carrier-protein] synthase-1